MTTGTALKGALTLHCCLGGFAGVSMTTLALILIAACAGHEEPAPDARQNGSTAGMTKDRRGGTSSVCSFDGWCPYFTRGTFLAVWGSGPDDVFVVGSHGMILHNDGDRWSPQATCTDQHLMGIWGSAGDNVYAASIEGSVIYFDGSSWKVIESRTLRRYYAIHGSGPDTVFAAGRAGPPM